MAVRIIAADNYSKTFNYEEVNGAFATYNVTDGQPLEHTEPLTPILAYHFNDANLSLSDGPLRVAIIGPEGLATSSSYWVKQIVRLEVRYRDDVAITAVVPLKTVVGQGYTCRLNVTVTNHGCYSETFNVTAYANQTAIGTMTATLSAGGSTTIVFTWNTTGFSRGNWTVSAVADTVSGETDIADNTYVNGALTITLVGDVGADGYVGIDDIFSIALHFGQDTSSSYWNPNCDINDDDYIGIDDIFTAALHFGEQENP
jgi:hypothetical protein